jgi:hypothetical protein
MATAYDHEDGHHLVEQLTFDQIAEVRAHALRPVTGHRAFVPWNELRLAAAKLPHIDYAEFRNEVDAAISPETEAPDHSSR